MIGPQSMITTLGERRNQGMLIAKSTSMLLAWNVMLMTGVVLQNRRISSAQHILGYAESMNMQSPTEGTLCRLAP